MNILFDKGSSQVQVHLQTGNRLNTLFAAIQEQRWTYSIGPDRIDDASLQGVDCLAILTRHRVYLRSTSAFPADWDFAFTTGELEAILKFSRSGRGLLLISNHGPFRPGDETDWTVNDRVLAAELGVIINPAAYQMPGRPRPPLTMSGPELSSDPLLRQGILAGVTSIVPHNSCAVSSIDPLALPIASIPPGAENTSPTFPEGPAGQYYALLVSPLGGMVIVGGNSGISGDPDSTVPGRGMIDEGSNKQFLINSLRYAGNRGQS